MGTNCAHLVADLFLFCYKRAFMLSNTGSWVTTINRDWVHNQACRLLHDILVLSHSFITFNNLFKLIT